MRFRKGAPRMLKRFWRAETGFYIGIWLFFTVMGRSRLFRDPGTFWHTVAGRRILGSGVFSDTDAFSFTFAGKTWIPHQWLGECLMAVLDGIGGLDMLLLATATVLAGLYTWAAHRLQAAALLLVMWRSWRSGMVDGIRYSAATALAFIILFKVLTFQYVIWLYQSVTVVEGRTGDPARLTFLLGRLTTAFIYPGPEFGLLLDHQDEGVFLMNIRNALRSEEHTSE